jgi:hypothetical protein
MDISFAYFTSWEYIYVFSGYVCVSQTIWLNFIQETKKFFEPTRSKTQTKDLKHPWLSSHRYDRNGYMKHMIYSSYEEVMLLQKCSHMQNLKFRFVKPGSDFHDSELNMSRDFLRVWLGLSYSCKGLCPIDIRHLGWSPRCTCSTNRLSHLAPARPPTRLHLHTLAPARPSRPRVRLSREPPSAPVSLW